MAANTTTGAEAVRVGSSSLTIGYKLIAAMAVSFVVLLGGVIDIAMDVGAIRQDIGVIRELQEEVAHLRENVASVELKLAVLTERVDAGLVPAGH